MAAARLSVLRALWSPTKIIPSRTVRDIREIDFGALKKAGYNAIVFDKDNCLTIPLQDRLVPELQSTFDNVKSIFGPTRVLIVSNSSGTPSEDPGYLEVEALERQLGVPILRHLSKKPSRKCAQEIRAYFDDHPPFTPTSTSSNTASQATDAVGSFLPPTIPATTAPTTPSAETIVSPKSPLTTSKISFSRDGGSQGTQGIQEVPLEHAHQSHQNDSSDAVPKFTPGTMIPARDTISAFPTISPTSVALDSSAPPNLASEADPSGAQIISKYDKTAQINQKTKLVVIGDRLMTDVLLANDMGAYSIWTTRLWEREALLLRSIERTYLMSVRSALFFANRVVPATIQSLRFIAYRIIPVAWGYLRGLTVFAWSSTSKSLQWTWKQLAQSKSIESRDPAQQQHKKLKSD